MVLGRMGLQNDLISYLSVCLAIHGGLHLSAWKFLFPTETRGFLWKIACFSLALGFVPLTLLARLSRQKYALVNIRL